MFSFIHTADIHLDSPLRGLNQHDGAPVEQIRGATRRALENIVTLAIERSVDFVIIAGDLYDGDWQDYNTGLFFNKQMLALKAASIPVYLISGNHDAESQITRSLNPPDNVHVFSTKKPETFTHPKLAVSLHGQGFAHQAVSENLALAYPPATPGHFNIGILHTSLTGSDPQHDPYAPCSLNDLTKKNYHYWALGHIHMHAVIQQNPHIVFSGNPQGRHIKETGERGCYLIEVDDDHGITTTFHPTDTVRWEAIELDISPIQEIKELHAAIAKAIEDALASADGRLLALRLTLTGHSPLHNALHAEHSQLEAQCLAAAIEIDEHNLWFERLRLKTLPTYDPQELANQDDLTAQVLDALSHFTPTEIPAPIQELAGKLSGIASKDLTALLEPAADDSSLREEISAIVLQALSTSAQ